MEADLLLLHRYEKSRDADAFGELVRRHVPMVLAVARRTTASAADAEDIAQVCFLELARKAGAIHGSVAGWLHAAAMHRASNLNRNAGVRSRHERSAAVPEDALIGMERAELDRLIAHVDAALAELPEDLRVPLVEHYLSGRTQAEISTNLRVNQSTVSRRLRDGIERLREVLAARGIAATGAVLPTALAAGTTDAVPEGLLLSLHKLALSGVGRVAGAVTLAKPVLAVLGVIAAVTVALVVDRQLRPAAPAAPKPVTVAQVGKEDVMTMNVEMVPATKVLYSSHRTTFAEAAKLGEQIGRMFPAARAAGLQPSGPAMFIYSDMAGPEDEFTLEIALPVRGDGNGNALEPFAVKTLPATRCAVVRYTGPMPTTPAWKFLDRESTTAGHVATGEIREVYEKFVSADSAENVTVIQRAIQ